MLDGTAYKLIDGFKKYIMASTLKTEVVIVILSWLDVTLLD